MLDKQQDALFDGRSATQIVAATAESRLLYERALGAPPQAPTDLRPQQAPDIVWRWHLRRRRRGR